MSSFNRRDFVKASTAGMLAFSAGSTAGITGKNNSELTDKMIRFRGDGLSLSPKDCSALLHQITSEREVIADYYSNGGEIEILEKNFARILGKERAIFMPSGTLANQIAARILAAEKKRVLVQEISHIYNDSGDCAQALSNLALMPLGHGKATFTFDEVKATIEKTNSGRVATARVGAIVIESPVRRCFGEMFDFEEMKLITAYARENGIGTHLDGARIFMASAYTGINPAQYAGLFDTVYVSLYKYFNAPFGAILAGPESKIDGLYHMRRMFGGGLPQTWMCAALVNHYLDGFPERFKAAVNSSERVLSLLSNHSGFKVKKINNGTNIVELQIDPNVELNGFRERLLKRNIFLISPANDFHGFLLFINETILRAEPEAIADAFVKSLN